jgi:serine/threonine protein kinase
LPRNEGTRVTKEPQSAGPAVDPVDETVPQWQPPAGATRSVVIAPPAARVGAPQPTGASSEPQAPSISGTRVGARGQQPVQPDQAQQIGLDHTLQAGSYAPPRPLMVGDIIGERYVIEQHISSGGFGAVYRASDRQIRHHQVALKLLHEPAADEQARQTALRELALIASVSHPSVVQFKDYGWYQGRLWFAMPWYRGETLGQRFADSAGPLAITRATARLLFERLARGLAAMHEVGINHHDIKPENIFVADIAGFDGGLPVLLDLGIASARGEGPKGLTVEYASPEVASAALGNHEKPIGSAADVFSLALVLRNLLEPETALPGQGELLPMLHRRATERVPAPSKREFRHLKPSFERWLSLDPDERPTAEEFAQEIAILTAPEERRDARNRLLRRLVPIVLLAAAAVTILLMQVRQQKTELTVKSKQLTQQVQQSEQLRQQSAEQLQQLEQKGEQIGEQSEQLSRAIAIARRLDGQLENAEGRVDNLTRKSRKLTEERDLLTTQRDALTRERDALQSRGDRLQQERDSLRGERDGLARERDSLTAERNALARDRERLERDRDTVVAQRNDTIRQRDKLQAELASVQQRLDRADRERDELRKSLDDARDELKDLRREVRDAQAQRKALEGQLKAQKPSRSSEPADPAIESAPQRVRLRAN